MNTKITLISVICILSLVSCGVIFQNLMKIFKKQLNQAINILKQEKEKLKSQDSQHKTHPMESLISMQQDLGFNSLFKQLFQASYLNIHFNLHFEQQRYFLTEQPRPYEIVLFFTAPKCDFCEQMLSQYQTTSQYYYDNNGAMPYKDNTKKLRAVFFGIMNFDQANRDIFLDLEFKSVPNLLVSVPKHAQVSDSERSSFLKGYRWQISGSDGLVTQYKLLEYINKRTGREIEYQLPLIEVITNLTILLVLITLSIVVFRIFKSFFLNTKLWFVGSIVIYFVCIAGFIYNQIHNVPMTNIDAKGNLQWMLDNQRMQLGAEGFVMSGLIIFSALSIIAWQLIARLDTKSLTNQLVFVAIFGITFIVVLKIEELYKFKGWYNIMFFPPDHYNKGPLMRDQGNSI